MDCTGVFEEPFEFHHTDDVKQTDMYHRYKSLWLLLHRLIIPLPGVRTEYSSKHSLCIFSLDVHKGRRALLERP